MKNKKYITGFKLPEGYLDSFEERLFDKIAEEKLPKSAGFHVPEGYFETLDGRVFNSIGTSNKTNKTIPLFRKKYIVYASALAACLIVGFMVFNTNPSSSEDFNSLQIAAIENYIEEGNLNLDLYDVTTYFDDDDISTVNFDDQQFSEVSLENYLLENIDEETLLNEAQ